MKKIIFVLLLIALTTGFVSAENYIIGIEGSDSSNDWIAVDSAVFASLENSGLLNGLCVYATELSIGEIVSLGIIHAGSVEEVIGFILDLAEGGKLTIRVEISKFKQAK